MFNASLLFPGVEITKRERQAGKRIVHASNYDAQPQRVSEALLDEGFFVSVEECAERQAIYHERFPAIRKSYQLRSRMLAIREKKLTNSFGFSIEFKYERQDSALWRRCYAWRAQSEIGYLLSQNGLIPARAWIKKHDLQSRIRFAVHDEIAITCPNVREAWDLARLLNDTLSEEREYEGEKLSIPADAALESRYHGRKSVEWKRLPDEHEFKETFEALEKGAEENGIRRCDGSSTNGTDRTQESEATRDLHV